MGQDKEKMMLISKETALEIHKRLLNLYPERKCALNFKSPYELLVASRLSAQCTDIRVNIVTEELFKKYPTEKDLAEAEFEDVASIIKSCGLGNTKARDIIAASKQLCELNGVLPDTMDGLLQIKGVGRKIANLLLGEIYHQEGVVIVDTHCIRLTNRMGFCDEDNPKKIEDILRTVIPAKESLDFCHAIVFHGRQVCKAQNPNCDGCTLDDICQKNFKQKGKSTK